jgi:hypothetical protein
MRGRIASYDSVMTLVIRGYAQLAGYPLHKLSGPLVIVFNRLVGAFDDEFERRLEAGLPLAFEEVMDAEMVRGRMNGLQELLAPYPTGDAIRDFLDKWVSKQYDRYVELMGNTASTISFDDCFEAAVIDSGGFATCIAHVIGLFNGAMPADHLVDQFSALGIVGKLADDLLDFWPDARMDRVNLLDAFVRQHPEEYARTRAVIARPPRTGLHWWAENCPQAITAFSEALDSYISHLHAFRLQQAAHAILFPAMWGKALLKSEPVNLRL